MYLLAILLPPLAVLLSGRPIQALINIPLTLLFWIPGMIHALFVVNDRKAKKRTEKQTKEILKASANQQSATTEVKRRNQVAFRVAGVTKQNENGEEISGILKRIASSYLNAGEIESFESQTKRQMLESGLEMSEFEGQWIDGIVRLEPEPTNPYDKNAIKVYLEDANGKEYHVGYVPRDRTQEFLGRLDKIRMLDVEFLGGKSSYIDIDENGKEVLGFETLTRALEITAYFE